jgi:hypothetical protein
MKNKHKFEGMIVRMGMKKFEMFVRAMKIPSLVSNILSVLLLYLCFMSFVFDILSMELHSFASKSVICPAEPASPF